MSPRYVLCSVRRLPTGSRGRGAVLSQGRFSPVSRVRRKKRPSLAPEDGDAGPKSEGNRVGPGVLRSLGPIIT